MIAADTSSLSAYLKGEFGPDVEQLATAIAAGDLVLPPVVVTEILTDPATALLIDTAIRNIATLEVTAGYWVRAGLIRRALRSGGAKAKVADALIAQSCIDQAVALIPRDAGFRHFATHCGLRLA